MSKKRVGGNATAISINKVCCELDRFLRAKNKNYGDSVADPVRTFSKANAEEGILVRMDDKLSRIKTSTELRKNDVVDLMGYLALLCAVKDWTDFSEMID